jgi:hypothetical protein
MGGLGPWKRANALAGFGGFACFRLNWGRSALAKVTKGFHPLGEGACRFAEECAEHGASA